ncbi:MULTISPECIES: fimbria/pilus periplasmic chaperone [unclassified Pseudomonas]|uniref:fimbrial biogenesis chaperone n=1 Tax=unclassified Pseudomonas TaxID=196821 RepID=UPI001032A2AB|nr:MULTISPECIES: fimbria/pilus periplasmic chaperone [unclassified Pseudomonas]
MYRYPTRLFVTWLMTFLSAVLCMSTAHASIVIDGTRVIYPAKAAEVTVRLTNKGEAPRLVQAWIDDGDEKSSPEKIDVPFIILTPIFRMDPDKGHALRVRYTQSKPVPTDRESVFWLNVLEIPAKPAGDTSDANYLQFSLRTRIKLFFRPEGLPGSAAAAPEQLVWQAQPGGLLVKNPSAFNVSLKRVELGAKGDAGTVEGIMVAPFSQAVLKLVGAKTSNPSSTVTYFPVNDYGGTPELKATALPYHGRAD